jgi:hypothetical protein
MVAGTSSAGLLLHPRADVAFPCALHHRRDPPVAQPALTQK